MWSVLLYNNHRLNAKSDRSSLLNWQRLILQHLTAHQLREKSNLASFYLFILYLYQLSSLWKCNLSNVSNLVFFCPWIDQNAKIFTVFFKVNRIYLVYFLNLNIGPALQQFWALEEKVCNKRERAAPQPVSSGSSVGVPQADLCLRATKRTSKPVVVILPEPIHIERYSSSVLPQRVPSLCTSYITLFCVGRPTSCSAVGWRGTHKEEEGRRTSVLSCSAISCSLQSQGGLISTYGYF